MAFDRDDAVTASAGFSRACSGRDSEGRRWLSRPRPKQIRRRP